MQKSIKFYVVGGILYLCGVRLQAMPHLPHSRTPRRALRNKTARRTVIALAAALALGAAAVTIALPHYRERKASASMEEASRAAVRHFAEQAAAVVQEVRPVEGLLCESDPEGYSQARARKEMLDSILSDVAGPLRQGSAGTRAKRGEKADSVSRAARRNTLPTKARLAALEEKRLIYKTLRNAPSAAETDRIIADLDRQSALLGEKISLYESSRGFAVTLRLPSGDTAVAFSSEKAPWRIIATR